MKTSRDITLVVLERGIEDKAPHNEIHAIFHALGASKMRNNYIRFPHLVQFIEALRNETRQESE